MKKLVSKDYTLHIDGLNVTMTSNFNQMQHSLSNLVITTYDILFFVATQHMASEAKAERIKQLIIGTNLDNIERLNKITNQNFTFA